MRRREFIILLGGATAWPLAARAQQGRLPVVGVLRSNPKDTEVFAEPFRRYMKAIGWEEGRNIRFLFVWTEGRSERAPALAGELVAQNVDLIITFGDPATRAAQRATQTIPIVGFTDDMIGSGFATSMARPGGNITGVSILSSELDVKRLEILHEFVPQARPSRCKAVILRRSRGRTPISAGLLKETVPGLANLVILWDPTTSTVQTRAVAAAAQLVGVRAEVLSFKSPSEFKAVFDAASARHSDALLLLSSPVVSVNSKQLAELALQHRLPAISLFSSFPRAGGLISYGPNLDDIYRETGVMAAKVLKGTKPADLPAERPTRFELIVNLKTARALGLTIAETFLVRADEVIE